MWESTKTPAFIIVGYSLLLFLSLIINLIRSQKIMLRILGYVFSAIFLVCFVSFVNQMCWDYFRIDNFRLLR